MLLLSSEYRDGKVGLKWFDNDTKKIVRTGGKYKPFCYTSEDMSHLKEFTSVRAVKRDILQDRDVELFKTTADKKSDFGFEGQKIECNSWELEHRLDELYLRENHLICGLEEGGKNNPDVLHSISLKRPSREAYVNEWKSTLSEPIPNIPRVALDIEIETSDGIVPDVEISKEKITCICLAGQINISMVLDEKGILKYQEMEDGSILIPYRNEAQMIVDAFNKIQDKMVLTFYGDQFDIPYMRHRLERLTDKTIRPNIVHLDLYKIYETPAFKVYVYPRKYTEQSLNAVAEGILGSKKIEFDVQRKNETAEELTELARYCRRDAILTHELTTVDDNLLIKILIAFSRMCRIPMERIGRSAVGNWTKSMVYHEHSRYNFLIPSKQDLKNRSVDVINESIGKKYKGAIVFEPVPGVHFDVTVLDFASLYPSIVKQNNISYETVRCPHVECKSNKIPLTNHWACTKHQGLETLLVGTLRDMRVDHYKKQKDHTSEVISSALKVFLNASYGVMGADTFPLFFLPAAEATTAIGRHIIQGSTVLCKKQGVEVIYGDSVLGDTPVVKKVGDDIAIVPIQSMCNVRRGQNNGQQKHTSTMVLSDNGFVKVNYAYAHVVKKHGFRIGTRCGYVECTNDHSLVVNGKEIKPSELKIGDKIDLRNKIKLNSKYALDTDLAWLFGFFLAEGTANKHLYKWDKFSWAIVQKDRYLLDKCKSVIEKNLGILTVVHDYRKSGSVHRINAVCGSLRVMYQFFNHHCYSKGVKIVPSIILNGTKEVKRAFLNGILDGDGHVNKKDGSVVFGQIHKSVLAGYVAILQDLRFEYSLKFRMDKPNFITVSTLRNPTDASVRPYDEITFLQEFEIDEAVYDLSTENEHFRGGLGNVLLHNTDSVFVLSPTEPQIKTIITEAKEKFKVDLEVDKVYRYVALSNRKKNYFGVMNDGSLDIKGLTGKKSNASPFSKKLFREILDILSAVMTKNEFESARSTIIRKITDGLERMRRYEIPMQDLTVAVKLAKPLESYGSFKKETDMFGKTTVVRKGLPQHIKAAYLMPELPQVGEYIKFVKTKTGEGVLMPDKAHPRDIDVEKYAELTEKILSQVLEPLDIMMPNSKTAGQTTLF